MKKGQEKNTIGILGNSRRARKKREKENKKGPDTLGSFINKFALMLHDTYRLDYLTNKDISRTSRKLMHVKNYSRINVGKSYLKLIPHDLYNLYRYCREEKPDIIMNHTHAFVQAPSIAIMGKLMGVRSIARFSGSTFDMHRHEKGLMKVKAYIANKWYMRLMFLADRLLVLGNSQKEEAIRHGCRADKIWVIPQPPNEVDFKPPHSKRKAKEVLDLPTTKRCILWIGNLRGYKGVSTLISLIKALDPEKYQVVVVGNDYENNSERLKGYPHVRYEGKVDHGETIKYYHAADLLVHTSYVEASIPNVIWEALACGVPCIGRDIRDINEVAYAVFSDDKELIHHVTKGKWMSSSTSKIPEKYRWDTLKRRYISLFEDLMERR